MAAVSDRTDVPASGPWESYRLSVTLELSMGSKFGNRSLAFPIPLEGWILRPYIPRLTVYGQRIRGVQAPHRDRPSPVSKTFSSYHDAIGSPV